MLVTFPGVMETFVTSEVHNTACAILRTFIITFSFIYSNTAGYDEVEGFRLVALFENCPPFFEHLQCDSF